ncbi:MAG: hypothetical protein AAB338_00820 [Patescibacteria group bacterium]
MSYTSKKILSFLLAAVFLLPYFSYAGIESWQKGITLRLRSQPKADIDAELAEIRQTGANYLTITPGWVTDSISSSNVDRKTNTPSDDLLIYTIDKAHELGMKVMLKPHLDLKDYSRWRANIDPLNKTLFFINYKAMLLLYAKISQAHKVEQFAIGSELFKLSSNRANEHYWRDVISEIRRRYSGKLTYSAVFGGGYEELNFIPFWDSLDYVGLSAYLPLANNTNPSIESLKASWAAIEKKYVIPALLKFNKPIIITEIGYKSIDGAAIKPEGNYSNRIDLQEQADLYWAFFEFWRQRDYFGGVHFWDWWPDPNRGGIFDKDFTPQDKPAEEIIRHFFGGVIEPPKIPYITPNPAITPVPVPSAPPDSKEQIIIFSPVDNSKISGEKKLKIYIENKNPETYFAAYSVNGEGGISMKNADPYFKQAVVQFDSWTQNGDGPYSVVFIARDLDGSFIDTASLTLFVKH